MNIFGGALRAFETFPAAILSALAFAIVTMIRIQLDWPAQEPYNFLFNCLHWAFALGAVFSMAAITIAQTRFSNKRAFLAANLLGAGVIIIAFLMLFFWGVANPDVSARYEVISTLAVARVSAAILISFLAFIIAAGEPKEQSDFAQSFFMSHKAFFIALLYGIVIVAGASGVAGAVQTLLYQGMSGKVYMYIGTIAGFLAFTIFLGYFPNFRKGVVDEHREAAQRQPRFIEILLSYILVPIIMALTVVLFLWSGRILLTGEWPAFNELAGIATAYSAVGLWLHIMVTHHESGLAKFYRRLYPFAALIILAFEAGAIVIQLEKAGLKVSEYWFILVWVISAIAAILLILLNAKAHRLIAAAICVASVFSVLPALGYHGMPVFAQIDRLERLLSSEGMLKDGKLIQAASDPELSVRESITDAVYFLAGVEDAKLPAWFDENLSDRTAFKAKLGFEPVWPKWNDGSVDYLGTSLYLKPDAMDVSNYAWGIHLQGDKAEFTGDKGDYRIDWEIRPSDGVPTLKISQDGRIILKEDMDGYIDRITKKYPPGRQAGQAEASLEDMSVMFESEDAEVLLIFNTIQINVDPVGDRINYYFDLDMIYLRENDNP
jgi:hypothetical protein